MDVTPSPLERLLQLEHKVEQLLSQQAQPPLPRDHEGPSLPPRHLWPGDELLLTRLLRRSPQAVTAYQGPAELSRTEQSGWLLHTAEAASVFQFCELTSGEAVVWASADPPAWLWGSETFQQLFRTPRGTETSEDLVLQSLPLFKPVVRSRRWSLFRTGEMVPRLRPFPEQEEQLMLLRRIETLERQLSQHRIQQNAMLGELRTQLRLQQDLLERLLRVSG